MRLFTRGTCTPQEAASDKRFQEATINLARQSDRAIYKAAQARLLSDTGTREMLASIIRRVETGE